VCVLPGNFGQAGKDGFCQARQADVGGAVAGFVQFDANEPEGSLCAAKSKDCYANRAKTMVPSAVMRRSDPGGRDGFWSIQTVPGMQESSAGSEHRAGLAFESR
jgi:hypothetical protein